MSVFDNLHKGWRSSVLIILMALLALLVLGGQSNSVSAQEPEGYTGPEGFEWVIPEDSCVIDNGGGILLSSEGWEFFGAQDRHTVLIIPNPDPEWGTDKGVPTKFVLFFEPGPIWKSWVRVPAHIMYSSEGCVNVFEVNRALQSYVHEQEQLGERFQFIRVRNSDFEPMFSEIY